MVENDITNLHIFGNNYTCLIKLILKPPKQQQKWPNLSTSRSFPFFVKRHFHPTFPRHPTSCFSSGDSLHNFTPQTTPHANHVDMLQLHAASWHVPPANRTTRRNTLRFSLTWLLLENHRFQVGDTYIHLQMVPKNPKVLASQPSRNLSEWSDEKFFF